MKQPKSYAARIVQKHGGTFTHGGSWCRGSMADEAGANALAEALRGGFYQIRGVEKAKDGKFEVVFR